MVTTVPEGDVYHRLKPRWSERNLLLLLQRDNKWEYLVPRHLSRLGDISVHHFWMFSISELLCSVGKVQYGLERCQEVNDKGWFTVTYCDEWEWNCTAAGRKASTIPAVTVADGKKTARERERRLYGKAGVIL